MASIKDIAARTGLSLATISRVFNDSPKVSAKTRQKVLKVAAELHYVPNIGAAALRSGKSRVIGVLIPEINNHFFGEVVTGIEKKMKNWGYNIIISQTHESSDLELEMLESFMKLNVDGIIISTTKEPTDPTIFKKLKDKKVPVVFFDRLPPVHSHSSVILDDHEGGQIATQHLIDQGCKHIVHIAGDKNVSIFQQRQRGFEDALKLNNHSFHSHQIFELTTDTKSNKKLIQKLLTDHPDIDGFFAHGDYYALYVMDILKSLNVDIPNKIKIVGFGNTDFTDHLQPSLTTVDQNCHQMGQLTAETLMKHIESDEIIHSKQVLTPKLVVRDSSN